MSLHSERYLVTSSKKFILLYFFLCTLFPILRITAAISNSNNRSFFLSNFFWIFQISFSFYKILSCIKIHPVGILKTFLGKKELLANIEDILLACLVCVVLVLVYKYDRIWQDWSSDGVILSLLSSHQPNIPRMAWIMQLLTKAQFSTKS